MEQVQLAALNATLDDQTRKLEAVRQRMQAASRTRNALQADINETRHLRHLSSAEQTPTNVSIVFLCACPSPSIPDSVVCVLVSTSC